jgi:hypothetical protein
MKTKLRHYVWQILIKKAFRESYALNESLIYVSITDDLNLLLNLCRIKVIEEMDIRQIICRICNFVSLN